jgi:hypothetical protein
VDLENHISYKVPPGWNLYRRLAWVANVATTPLRGLQLQPNKKPKHDQVVYVTLKFARYTNDTEEKISIYIRIYYNAVVIMRYPHGDENAPVTIHRIEMTEYHHPKIALVAVSGPSIQPWPFRAGDIIVELQVDDTAVDLKLLNDMELASLSVDDKTSGGMQMTPLC